MNIIDLHVHHKNENCKFAYFYGMNFKRNQIQMNSFE